jgi:hypothetical protein
VELYFDRRYRETDSAIAALEKSLATIPPTRVTLDKPRSISQAIADLYGFGKKEKSRTYEKLYSEIMRLNNVKADGDISGTVFVPTVPRWSPTVGYSPANPSLGFNHLLAKNRIVVSSRGEVATDVRVPAQDTSRLAGAGHLALASHWLDDQSAIKGAVAAVLRIATDDPSSLVPPGVDPASVMLITRGPFDVESPAEAQIETGPEDESFSLTVPERTAIQGALTRQSVTVPLVVLDLEWPGVVQAQLTTNWLYGILNEERSTAHVSLLIAPHLTPAAAATNFPHSSAIADAIRPMTDLDALGQAVSVQYLPLVAAPGADAVLTDLISTYLLLRRAEMSQTVPDGVTAQTNAVATVKELPKTADDSSLGVVHSTRMIADALIYVLDRHAHATGIPYVVNMSWVLADPLSAHPAEYSPIMGLIVAAVGNKGEDVVANRRDLTRWSADSRYVLSVENYTAGNQLTCQSSVFPIGSEAVDFSRVVAYRGGRSPTDPYKCGTSFSAPRVAWAIAAGFAATGKVDTAAVELWADNAWKRIRNAAPLRAGARNAHPFDVARWLSP